MTAPVMFNRRLGKNELNIAFELVENQTEFGCIDREQATRFLNLENTISFVSSIMDKIIGGTIIYRDRTRLGMVLASVVVAKEFREKGAYSIIKSSLPFFRSVAIRDVDALVPDDKSKKLLGFPGTLELDWWTKDILERIGFAEQDNLSSYIIQIDTRKKENYADSRWDSQPNIQAAKNLIWNCSKKIGMTNSLIWTHFDSAASQGRLRTVTQNDSMRLVTSIYHADGTAIIDLLVSDEDFETAARQISSLVKESRCNEVILPLIGEGQSELIQAVADELGGSLKRKSMTLMRRHL
ncbi:hypothetical protein EU528_01835 [Candidatus Thorarchaeota archaeon]|nr:MAG: hypothetical protein EU528_01835 [Candidatus Thorarchaeota archaeon]